MRKFESLFIGICFASVLGVCGVVSWRFMSDNSVDVSVSYSVPESRFGSFLSAQHAIHVNDFETAHDMLAFVPDVQYSVVNNSKILSEFLTGRMPAEGAILKDEKSLPSRFIYDAYLLRNNMWSEFFARHKNEESALFSALRIWGGVANNHKTNTIKYINSLKTNDSWKSFVRGQVYANLGDIDTAVREFSQVSIDFMNLNDYMYLMSFYMHHDMSSHADALRARFTARPSGLFMLNYTDIPDWSVFSGYKNSLAFGIVQAVSHTQVLMYSDMSLMMLRFAELIAPEYVRANNIVNYYVGMFYFNNTGDFRSEFGRIDNTSPYKLFALLRMVERGDDIDVMRDALSVHPLFVPAMNKMIGYYISRGDRSGAMSVVSDALKQDGLSDSTRAFFYKSRAQIHYSFGDLDSAQRDISYAKDVLGLDEEIMSLQAKIWAAQNREIETAYKYAITLVSKNPSDVLAWDTLGCVVAVREGADAALEVLHRVGEISDTHSSLFMHLGDIYMSLGDVDKAKSSYIRAIDLSDDGLVVVPELERKLRKLK